MRALEKYVSSPWAWLGLAFVVAIIYFSGINGFYCYDYSIGLFSGWLVRNGWAPFVDYTTPIMPLSAILYAISYLVFGVSLHGTVLFTTLAAAVIYGIVQYLISSYLPKPGAVLAATVLCISALGPFGLFYNYLVSALFCVCCPLLFRYIDARFEQKPLSALRLCLGGVLALILLSKMHVGIAYTFTYVLVELALLVTTSRFSLRAFAGAARLVAAPMGGATAFLLIWIHFHLKAMAHQITAPAPIFFWRLAFGLPHDIRAPMTFSPFYAVAITGFGLIAFWAHRRTPAYLRLLAATLFAAANNVLTIVSNEMPIYSTPVFVFGLIALYDCAKLDRSEKGVAALMWPTLAVFMIFSSLYSIEAWRKNSVDIINTPTTLGFSTLLHGVETQQPYFAKMKLTVEQKNLIEEIAQLKAANPGKRIMFGVGMEGFFPAFQQLPPKGWVEWLDTVATIRPSEVPRLGELFDAEKYDFVVIDPEFTPMKGRVGVPFDISTRPYKLIRKINNGVLVYQRTSS